MLTPAAHRARVRPHQPLVFACTPNLHSSLISSLASQVWIATVHSQTWTITGTGCEVSGNGLCITDGAGNYGSSETCTATASVAISSLDVQQFDLEYKSDCGWDSVTINSQAYCGTGSQDRVLQSGVALAAGGTVEFQSDPTNENAGFTICAPAPSPSPSPPPPGPLLPPDPPPPAMVGVESTTGPPASPPKLEIPIHWVGVPEASANASIPSERNASAGLQEMGIASRSPGDAHTGSAQLDDTAHNDAGGFSVGAIPLYVFGGLILVAIAGLAYVYKPWERVQGTNFAVFNQPFSLPMFNAYHEGPSTFGQSGVDLAASETPRMPPKMPPHAVSSYDIVKEPEWRPPTPPEWEALAHPTPPGYATQAPPPPTAPPAPPPPGGEVGNGAPPPPPPPPPSRR